MKTTYYVINKSDMSSCRSSRDASAIASYLLGRRLDNFILVKDDGNPRVIVPQFPDVTSIQSQLEHD